MGMNFSCSSSGYSLLFGKHLNNDFFDSDGSYESDNESNYNNYNYYIIDNRMKDDLANNIKNFVKTAFERYNSTKERSEYLQNILGQNYSNNFWNVFIYQNGYCKVSFSDGLYICGKEQDDYVIIFGQNKSNINSKNIIGNEKNNNVRNNENSINNKYKYYIIDNQMKEYITINIINFVYRSFNENRFTKERTEYIKNKLDEKYSNIFWNVFIYQNGYCKVSFSDELYICGRILNDYIIIFGHYKKLNKSKDNISRPRSKSLSSSPIKNRDRSRSRSRSRSKDNKEN